MRLYKFIRVPYSQPHRCIWHKTYRHCLHTQLEGVCKVLRHNSYCKWADGAIMVWCTPANKTPRLSSVIVGSCCAHTNCPRHVTRIIIPIHEWKVSLKYWGMLTFPFWGRWGQDKRRTPWSGGGTYKTAGIKIYEYTHTEATQKLKEGDQIICILLQNS